jgi:hypothetical protein
VTGPPDDDQDHDRILAEMLALAERLTAGEDAMMEGQYEHLRARVAALIALRSAGTLAS